MYKIIFGHVDMRSDDFFELRSTTTTGAILTSCFICQCACTVRSSFFTERRRRRRQRKAEEAVAYVLHAARS